MPLAVLLFTLSPVLRDRLAYGDFQLMPSRGSGRRSCGVHHPPHGGPCGHRPAMPTRPAKARAWLDEAKQADRKNARVIDKIMVALPLELDAAQREALIRVFLHRLTGDRVPWLAAIHDLGKDAHNPHAHLVIRNRDRSAGGEAFRQGQYATATVALGGMPKSRVRGPRKPATGFKAISGRPRRKTSPRASQRP